MEQLNNGLKYLGYSIVFQEVPNEVSLAINISGCPYKCRGCHSEYLWEYKGRFVNDDLDTIISKNAFIITCVCFMGGDQNQNELKLHLKHIKDFYKLKTCLYTGLNNVKELNTLLKYLDYIKFGEYNEKLGGLDKITTNQKMFTVNNGYLEKDITSSFLHKYRDISK